MEEEISVVDKIDALEAMLLANLDKIDCPLKHRFTPGLYMREIFMPKGAVVTSLIHKTTHPFFVLKGKVSVYSENDGEQLIEAPFVGITRPGTRRVLVIHEDCVWITCHPTDIRPKDDSEKSVLEAVALIRDVIIEPHENELVGGVLINNVLTKTKLLHHKNKKL